MKFSPGFRCYISLIGSLAVLSSRRSLSPSSLYVTYYLKEQKPRIGGTIKSKHKNINDNPKTSQNNTLN